MSPNPSNSLDAFAGEKLAGLEASALRRRLAVTARGPEAAAERGGRSLVSFSCNDYLGLAHDPRVIAAATEALARYGAGAGASRLVTGNSPRSRRWRSGLLGTRARRPPSSSARAISPISASPRPSSARAT
ncbi:hypothetical protein MSPGM_07010 [Methylorubrum sp. GM97]|nr:hypothetical protein MSPGM_07010 [Methylorubrum sp. GM97]